MPFFSQKERLVIEKDGEIYKDIRVLPAPDPEDIVWRNIGVSRAESLARKLLTYSITALILCISFVITYSLANAQAQASNNRILSLILSLSIATINVLICVVIELLSMQ